MQLSAPRNTKSRGVGVTDDGGGGGGGGDTTYSELDGEGYLF